MMEMVVVLIKVPNVLLIQVMQQLAQDLLEEMEVNHVIKGQVENVEINHVMMIQPVIVMELVIHFYQAVLQKEQDVFLRHHYALHIKE